MTGLISPHAVDGRHAPKLRAHVSVVPVGQEAILLEEGVGGIHQANQTAAAICSLFDGQATLSELIDDFVAVFQGDPDEIAHDVLEVTRELGRKGLLEGVRGDHETGASS